MARFTILFVILAFWGTLLGRTTLAASQDDGSRTVSSDRQDASSPDWMTSYYQDPQPDRFVSEVRKMSEAKALSSPNSEPPVMAFLSRVFAQNPEKIQFWMAALADLSDDDKKVLYEAIWFSDTKVGKKYLEEQRLTKFLKKPAPNILKMEIDSPSVLDMLWGYFFATGDEAPIRRIISSFNYSKYSGALDRYKTSKKNRDDKLQAYYDVIYRAAAWSLTSNCRQHRRVKEICDKLLMGKDLNQTETRCLKAALAELVVDKDAKNDGAASHWLEDSGKAVEKEWAKAEQGFGAMLLFTDKPQQFLDDWDKPTKGVHLSTSESAPRGKPCSAFIVFTACGEDKQGLADVVADLTVLAPDGKVYGEQKDVEIWQKKPAPHGKQLQLGIGNLGIVIEPNDPVGSEHAPHLP